MNPRPYPWEKSYPPGISWDTPIETTTLHALIDRSAARYADRPAIEFRGRRLLYKELAEGSRRIAAGLLSRGIGPAPRSAFICRTRPNIRWRCSARRGPARASCS